MKKLIFIMIILIGSISFVSACPCDITPEPPTYNITIEINDTFTQLNKDIEDTDELNLTHDYQFISKNDTAYENGIFIEKNITINGNNHVIDAKGKANIFNIFSSNVILKNLIIKNAPRNTIYSANSNITTINVTFINNTKLNAGACIYASDTQYTSINDNFIDNYAKYGSGICIIDGKLNLINATFKNSKEINRGLIAIENTEIMIMNTTFSNITSNYTSVIYSLNSRGIVKNSKFINLHADKTAGAIAFIEMSGTLTIENCTFINSTSRKNGGAIYCDLGESESETVNLINSIFTNCSSAFGGAYLQLSGKLNIENSTFSKSGNPLYASDTQLTITNSKFIENSEEIYLDNSNIKITTTEFNNSKIKIYDSKYQITNSNFTSSNISTYFDAAESYVKNNKYSDSIYIANQREYTTVINNNASKSNSYTPTIFLKDAMYESYFDLRDYGLVSPVKDQLNSGSCWAFATASAFESALLKIGINITLSQNNIKNIASKYSKYGYDDLTNGGIADFVVDYLSSWLGPVSEDDDDFDALGKISQVFSQTHYTFDVVEFGLFNHYFDNIKEALVKFGAVYATVWAEYDDDDYYNDDTSAAYFNGFEWFNNHAICIIGWDDNFSKDNFNIKPEGDGAWICKNSWGSNWGNEGYYYVSYYDYSITPILAFRANPEIYNKNYQYSYISYTEFEYDPDELEAVYGNCYTSNGNDLISAIGTKFMMDELEYTISIYINDKLVYSQEGESEFGGFNTIKLNSYISVNKNDKFRVEIKSEWGMPVATSSRTIYPPNTSYYIQNNKIKYFPTDKAAIIKVYTIANPIESKNMITYYTTAKTKFTVENITGSSVIIKVDGKKYTVKIKNKTASLNLNLKKGNHIIITKYNGKKIINQILVKSTIKCLRTLNVIYKTKYSFKVKFVDKNGRIIKNKKITAKFNKKTVKGRTNSKGIFKVKISNKLKKGKYRLTLINPTNNETLKVTVNVISQFKAKNMKMYYFDGSAYKFRVLNNNLKKIKVKLDSKTYKLKTDKNGYATLKISSKIQPGMHNIIIKNNGEKIKRTITVKKIIKNIKVKKTKKTLILKVNLKKKITGKKIRFKVNGKTYSAKSYKGTAKTEIKKPKKGKYALTVKYYKTSTEKRITI